MPKLELAPITPFCINDPNFDLHELFDLTSIPVTIITGPANTNALTIQYYTSLYNAQNGISPIANPNNYLVSIPSPHTETTLYLTINASGFCSTIVPATIRFCEAMGGGGSGGGGGGGTGGGGDFGACLETGEPIPSYDLNVVYNSTMSAIVPLPVPLGFLYHFKRCPDRRSCNSINQHPDQQLFSGCPAFRSMGTLCRR
jgi:hypothetical protein